MNVPVDVERKEQPKMAELGLSKDGRAVLPAAALGMKGEVTGGGM